MPPLPNIANVLKIALLGNSGEATPINWANILHAAWSGTSPTTAILGAIATEIISQWTTHMAPEQVSNTTLTGVNITDLTSNTAAAIEQPASVAGTRGDDELPANVSYLVTYPIAVRYRGGHPRQYLYVGGISDFLDAAHWSTAFTAEAASHWEAFIDGWTNTTYSGCAVGHQGTVTYVNKALNPVPPYRRTTPIFYDFGVNEMVGHQQMATQRRRVGRHRT